MTTTQPMTELYFTTSRKGQRRAWRWDARWLRAFPMPRVQAEALVAQGLAVDIKHNPLTSKEARW